ncbi:hypothetical protein [Streptomyces misionensis]|uniref:hypothetical protein n=1 Tax=Streptomyces misionensis TaxID=67331 RepID=UPI001FC9FBDC|nr:hypothetical protein [Streptomyces misionensis]
MVFDEPGLTLVQLIDLSGESLDALGRQAQRQVGGLGHRVLASPTVVRGEARAGAEQLGVAQAEQPFPQGGIGDDQDALSWSIAWVRALTAETLARRKIRALCTGPSPDLARVGEAPLHRLPGSPEHWRKRPAPAAHPSPDDSQRATTDQDTT